MFRTPHTSLLIRTAAMLKASTASGCISAVAVCPLALRVATRRFFVTAGLLLVGPRRSRRLVGSLLHGEKQGGMNVGWAQFRARVAHAALAEFLDIECRGLARQVPLTAPLTAHDRWLRLPFSGAPDVVPLQLRFAVRHLSRGQAFLDDHGGFPSLIYSQNRLYHGLPRRLAPAHRLTLRLLRDPPPSAT